MIGAVGFPDLFPIALPGESSIAAIVGYGGKIILCAHAAGEATVLVDHRGVDADAAHTAQGCQLGDQTGRCLCGNRVNQTEIALDHAAVTLDKALDTIIAGRFLNNQRNPLGWLLLRQLA